MKKHGYRKVFFTLAMSFLILCGTQQCSGLVFTGIEKALVFLIFAALILFIINRTSTLFDAILATAFGLVAHLLVRIPLDLCRWLLWKANPFVEDPQLPSRFQRPPPLQV
jgi:hypothetical protein